MAGDVMYVVDVVDVVDNFFRESAFSLKIVVDLASHEGWLRNVHPGILYPFLSP